MQLSRVVNDMSSPCINSHLLSSALHLDLHFFPATEAIAARVATKSHFMLLSE